MSTARFQQFPITSHHLPPRQPPRNRSRGALIALAASAALLGVAACSSGSGGQSENTFTIALIEPDLTTVPLMEAAEILRTDGYEITIVELAEPELAIEGLSKGDYAISAEATSPALIAIEKGAPIQIIADVIGNQWAVYTQPGITSCDDLVDRPVGIFSEGAVATAMVREWVDAECTSGEPQYLVIGGSDVRAQALVAGQIDGTALELADAVTLSATGTDLHELVDFGSTLPDLHPQTVYANSDFLADNPEAAQAFVNALIKVHADINADPEVLVTLAETHLGSTPDETLSAIAAEYVERGLFNAGALTPENVQGTVDFFVEAGVIEPTTADDVSDLTFLTNAG